MTRSFKNIAAGFASVAVLFGATAYSANAYYLGYGNGDATNEDFWAEQGATPAPSHPAPHRAVAYHAAPAHHLQRTAHHRKPGAHEQNIAHHHAAKQPTKQS